MFDIFCLEDKKELLFQNLPLRNTALKIDKGETILNVNTAASLLLGIMCAVALISRHEKHFGHHFYESQTAA